MEVKYITTTNKKLSNKGVKSVKKCLLPPNTICVSCIGSDLGKVVITKENTVTNQQINSIIIKDRYDLDFIYYSLKIIWSKIKI